MKCITFFILLTPFIGWICKIQFGAYKSWVGFNHNGTSERNVLGKLKKKMTENSTPERISNTELETM